jgi:hypothetical protein
MKLGFRIKTGEIASRWNRLAPDAHAVGQPSSCVDSSASRRGLVRAALTGALAAMLGGLVRAPGNAQEKMSKQAADYQDAPKGMLMCATCTLFVPPKSCKVVEGDVKPEGWCKAFDLAD